MSYFNGRGGNPRPPRRFGRPGRAGDSPAEPGEYTVRVTAGDHTATKKIRIEAEE
jgi:hypothetical protein